MDGRSVSADRRRAVAAVACVAISIAACSATSPPPLPPRRVDFPAQTPPEGGAPGLARPADLPDAAEGPSRDERYLGWTLAADFLSIYPLLTWGYHPSKVAYAAAPLLLVPAIHVAHGEIRNAGLSLAMRGAMLGVVYLTARWIDSECNAPSASQEAACFPILPLYLGTMAIVATMSTDAFILARRRRPASEWDRLPLLGATAAGDGRRLLTLSVQF